MFRKMRKKTRGALQDRSGGVGGGPRVSTPGCGGGSKLARGEEGAVGDSSSGSSDGGGVVAGGMNVTNFAVGSSGVGVQARSSPFRTPRVGGAGVEPAWPFYFSPQNSRHAPYHHKQAVASGSTDLGSTPLPSPRRAQPPGDGIKCALCSVERMLRQVVFCSTVFILGTMVPERASTVHHALELSLVAWGTCMLIITLGWFQNYLRRCTAEQNIISAAAAPQSLPTPMTNDLTTKTSAPAGPTRLEMLEVSPRTISAASRVGHEIMEGSLPNETMLELNKKRTHDEVSELIVDDRKPPPKAMRRMRQRQITVQPEQIKKHKQRQQKGQYQRQQQHPQLEDLYVMLEGKQERIFPNTTASEIDNELFLGKMLLRFRTSSGNDPAAAYFRGKQRRFEFQWQYKLKKLPPGDVFMAVECDEPFHMGMIQRALCNTILKFMKKLNGGFSYHFSDSYEGDGPSYLSFPIGTSMDRLHVARPGEAVPVLGQEIVEDAESIKRRKRGVGIEWNTEDVYTMAVWSAYFDWINWQILNFPGIRPFSANSMAGIQPIRLSLYTTPQVVAVEKNPRRDIIFAMEVSNAAKSILGSEAKKWNAENYVTANEDEMPHKSVEVEYSEVESINGNELFEEEDEGETEEQSDQMFDDTGDIEDLEEDDEGLEISDTLDNMEGSCYLLSGSSISLREGTGNYVASGGGYAVLQSSPTSPIVLEKVQPKKTKGAALHSPTMIRSGDIVQVKLVYESSKAVKYLCLHRGWWLRWSSARPKKNGSFYMHTGEPNGSLINLGHTFSLVSRRWSHYLIGACSESSAKYGGRMLGIYKTEKNLVEDEACDGEEEDALMQDNELDDKDFPSEKIGDKRMMPLLLCTEAFYSIERPLPSSVNSPSCVRRLNGEENIAVPTLGLTGLGMGYDNSSNQTVQKRYESRFELDVPAWLEVMNRTTRMKQLVYAVRVKETVLVQNKGPAMEDSEKHSRTSNVDMSQVTTSHMFVKLRTGRAITPLLSLGAEYKSDLSPSSDQWKQRFDLSNQDGMDDADSFTSSSDDSDSEELDDEPSDFLIAGPNHSVINETFTDQMDNYADEEIPDNQAQNADLRISLAQQDITPTTSPGAHVNSNADDSEKRCKEKSSNYLRRTSSKMKRDPTTGPENAEDFLRAESSTSTADPKQVFLSRVNSQLVAAPPFDPNFISPQSNYLFGQDDLPLSNEAKKKNKVKHAAVIGRVAKTMKSSTVITGKHVIKHSKNIGKGTVKGTVNAGKAAGRVIPRSSVVYSYKQPRKHEPGGRVHRKRSDKGQIKMVGRVIKNIEGQGNISVCSLSGQLLAPDQSCRKVSQILLDISNNPQNSAPILEAISSLVTSNSAQDSAFLRGSSAELGVKRLKPVDPNSDIDCVVARCIYDGRWCEELCVVYSKGNHIAFYAPLAKKPSLVVSFEEIMSAQICEEGESFPLPGLQLLAIETAWKCHYIAFLVHAERENFLIRLNDALFYMKDEGQPNQSRKVAPEYENYRMSLEVSLTGTVGKWRAVSISKKSKQKKQRRILNSRRAAFDLVSITDEKETTSKGSCQDKVATYVENLLRMALSLSPDILDATDSRFIEFLDETSRLRTLPLHEIDLSSKGAFCIFVNLYHCLLQHSLLLAVDGLPSRRSVTHFKRCSCYEIGGDVFSLAELECCVIRGNTSRPSQIKPPFVDIAKTSRPYTMMYGLGATDHRVNFVLNNGDKSYPSAVPVLQLQSMDDQMDIAASCFLRDQLKIDNRKRTVLLPKVCDVYCNDFGMGDGLVCLSQCLIYLKESDQLAIAALLDEGVVSVKFQRNCEDFHPNLIELS